MAKGSTKKSDKQKQSKNWLPQTIVALVAHLKGHGPHAAVVLVLLLLLVSFKWLSADHVGMACGVAIVAMLVLLVMHIVSEANKTKLRTMAMDKKPPQMVQQLKGLLQNRPRKGEQK